MFTITEIEQLDFIDPSQDYNDVPEHLRPNEDMISNFRKNCQEMGMYD